MKYVESADGYSHSVGYEYDEINNLTALVETINGVEHTTSYAYDEDNRITSVTNGSVSETYTYDAYGRTSQQQTKKGSTIIQTDVFTYNSLSPTSTTVQIAEHAIFSADYNKAFRYTYDKNGNIQTVSDGTYTTSYVYDSANQLIRENNQKQKYTYTWTYDDAGNILTRTEYAYTTGALGTATDTVTYTYGDSDWGDLLTSYDGNTLTYDTIGNLLSDGTLTCTWQHGRQLASVKKGSTTYYFTYNADGLRTECAYGSNTIEYIYNGSQLSRMTINDAVLDFTYDASGTPLTVSRNGEVYFYVTNQQGDVLDILDSSGTPVGSYSYTAWGACDVSGNDSIAQENPLRYRGYVYDDYTGLYYLQSRYYNPEIGRFINADNYAATGQGFIGNNMFAYCLNNPVMGYDPTGQMDWGTFLNGTSLLGIGLIACAAAATVVSGGACTPVLIAACITFAAGGMTVLNGTAEMVESTTGYNYMRDGVYGGNTEFYEGQKAFFQTTAEVGTAALGLSSGFDICFVGGTLILTAEGPKAIETIAVGELVWAWDEETDDKVLKRVVETYVNETYELVHVFVNGEEIVTTPEHPFYSPIKGWTDAVKLRAGDILVLVNGEYVVVEKIQHEILEEPITVYNFQVEGSHTYYVSSLGVLVHNSCGSRNRLRQNMLSLGPAPGSNYQAHHGLPWQFRDYFSQAGLDVNDVSFGIWVLGGGNGGHQSWSHRYAQLWEVYISNHPIPDMMDIIDYFCRLNGLK